MLDNRAMSFSLLGSFILQLNFGISKQDRKKKTFTICINSSKEWEHEQDYLPAKSTIRLTAKVGI